MKRREFLAGASAAGLSALSPRLSWAADVPKDIRITRVVSLELELTRPKHVGKNSYRHDHGAKAYDRVLRIHTNAGIEGIGTCRSGANECAALLGRNPLEFFNHPKRRMNSPLARNTSPIWDLVGKILGKPVYELLSEPKNSTPAGNTVPVYDGSIYFTDLRPEHWHDWEDEFKRELDRSVAMGHRACKIKIGRGRLWMLAEEGFRRDVEVVRLIRKHVGPDFLIGVDANDGYDVERTRRFLQETADCKPAFIEEMFPEDIGKYLQLKAFLRDQGLDILIADGENKRLPEQMRSWVESRAVDILQGDMNQFGLEDVLAEAAMARPFGATVAPHNWGSLFGFHLQLQVGRAVPNFYRAEQDPLTCPAVRTDGYHVYDGACSLPDEPGLGMRLLDAALPEVASVHFDLKKR